MNFSWRGTASCFHCGVDYYDIDPATIIESNDRNYVLCACCMDLIHVDRLGDYLPKEPIKMKYHADSDKVIKDLCKMRDEGDGRAKLILHEIKVMRAKMGFDPIKFPSE